MNFSDDSTPHLMENGRSVEMIDHDLSICVDKDDKKNWLKNHSNKKNWLMYKASLSLKIENLQFRYHPLRRVQDEPVEHKRLFP